MTLTRTVLAASMAAVAFAGCTSAPRPARPAAAASVTLTAPDSGREVALVSGQRLVVSLAANPTTGYQWALVNAGGLVPVGEPAYTPDAAAPGTVGSGGTSVWTFAAERPGRGTLRLAYGRAFEPGVPPAETFEVPVVVP